MEEYVSKEKVIELLCGNCTENCTGGTPYRCYVPCVEFTLIQGLPAADVKENVRGEWIGNYDPHFGWEWKCSKCGATCYGREDFCWKCGADMRGESQ